MVGIKNTIRVSFGENRGEKLETVGLITLSECLETKGNKDKVVFCEITEITARLKADGNTDGGGRGRLSGTMSLRR